MGDFKKIETAEMDKFIQNEWKYTREFEDIKKQYHSIVDELMLDWKGYGADAFRDDANVVISNLAGIGDTLSSICDILNDCRDIFEECDNSLAQNNRDYIE